MNAPIRLKFVGSPAPLHLAVKDEAPFNENQHPRAPNGQFTSGGGAAGKQVHGGVTAPKKGTSAHNIWSYAALCEEQGKPVNTANVVALAQAAGVELNKSNTQQTIPLYKKFQAGAKEAGVSVPLAPPAAPAKPKLENNPETFSALSTAAGLKSEGEFGGIIYYKNATAKASYDPVAKTWQVKKTDGTIKKGSDINELAEALKVDPAQAAKASKEAEAKAAAEKAVAGAKAKAETAAAHSTINAALYGHKAAVVGKHGFTSKGAANETALSSPLKSSLKAYVGSGYKRINKAMRFDADYSKTDIDTLRDVLNLQQCFKAVPPCTQDINVGRKVGMEALKTMARDAGIDSLNDLSAGVVLRDTGIISTSHSKHVWSGDVKFDIKIPKGSKVIDLSESMNVGEAELVLPPGSGLKILSVTKAKSGSFGAEGYHIECEHVL